MNGHQNCRRETQHNVCRVELFLALAVGIITTAQLSGPAAWGQGTQNPTAEEATYKDDALFNQLSGAARARAEFHFGRKPRSKEDAAFPESSGWFMPVDLIMPNSLVPNPLVNNPAEDTTAQDTQSETTLALAAGNNVVCAFNDSTLYNGSTSFKFTGYSQSGNSAGTWVDRISLPTNPDGDAGDPVLAYSTKTGTLLLSTLSLNFAQDLVIFRSIDNGLTFTGPVQGAPGYTSATGDQDKDWLACDNFPGPGYGNFYFIWRNFAAAGGITLTRSTNDGASFLPAPGLLLASNTGQGANVSVGPDHSVYCFWFDGGVTPARIVMRKSTDFGVTFGPIVLVTTLSTTGVNGDLSLGGYRSNAFPQLAVNPITGAIYIVYPDTLGADHGNIYFRQSLDGGATWSAAVRVNDDATTRAQFQPGIACRPDGTGLAVCWYDRRRDPADALIERWGTAATISGAVVTFGTNFRLSEQFPAVYGVDPVVNSVYMGDYDQMVADNNYFYTTWGDNRDQSTAVPSRKNANVRSARFTMAGPGPVLGAGTATVLGGNGNGLVEPNECNDLTLMVRNDGSGVATGISATLSTTTPGVTIIQGSSAYPDIAAGASAVNTTTFRIYTSRAFVCGTPLNLNLNLAYAGGPDVASYSLPVNNSGYVITQSSGATLVPGTTDSGNHGDDVTTTISLPFQYSLYGVNYITATLSSNGNIQFGTVNTAFSNTCLPATGFTDSIFPFWDDLRTDSAGGGIFTSVSGVAPNRIFNVEWRGIYYATSTSVNFEARLYEGQERLDFIYGNLNGNGSSATVGLQHGSSSTQFECNSGGLTTGLQLTFQRQPCTEGNGPCLEPPPLLWHGGPGSLVLEFQTVSAHTYYLEYTDSLDAPTWHLLQSLAGDDTVKGVTVSTLEQAQRFFRLRVQ